MTKQRPLFHFGADTPEIILPSVSVGLFAGKVTGTELYLTHSVLINVLSPSYPTYFSPSSDAHIRDFLFSSH